MDQVIDATRRQVAAHEPGTERARQSQAQILALIDAVDEPFSREAQPEHITASAVVLSSAGVLLHVHKKLNRWIGPGGHVDPGENPAEAVIREVLEETGIEAWGPHGGDAVLVDLDVHPTSNGHVHHDLRFLLVARPDQPSPGPGESQQVAWFEPAEALVTTDGSFRAALEEALKITDPGFPVS